MTASNQNSKTNLGFRNALQISTLSLKNRITKLQKCSMVYWGYSQPVYVWILQSTFSMTPLSPGNNPFGFSLKIMVGYLNKKSKRIMWKILTIVMPCQFSKWIKWISLTQTQHMGLHNYLLAWVDNYQQSRSLFPYQSSRLLLS